MSTSIPFILAITLWSQDAGASKLNETQVAQVVQQYGQEQVEKYEFYLDEAHTKKLELVEKPVMRWTADGNLGAVWVWTRQGRAEVIGCLGAFTNSSGQLEGFHEFHSLTLKPLAKVEIGTVRSWESRGPGVVPKLLDNAPDPAATEKMRLVQMRSLAREFTGHMQAGKQTHELRLTPTPLFRFSSTNPDVFDGALFSYLWDNGTDPEFLLLLEARQTEQGLRWHFSPVRFTWREVWLTHNSREVWRGNLHSEFHTSRILRDCYVTCETGPLNLNTPGRKLQPTGR